MTSSRKAFVLLMVAALAATSVSPTFARNNTGAYAKSIEATKKREFDAYCAGMRNDLAHAESEADKVAGTKAAGKWAKLADKAWEDAHNAGCGWAA